VLKVPLNTHQPTNQPPICLIVAFSSTGGVTLNCCQTGRESAASFLTRALGCNSSLLCEKMSFLANCLLRTEVKMCKKKTVVLLHEFDDNVAVGVTTVVSITTGIVQFQAKQRLRRRLVQLGIWFAYRRGVSPAPVGIFQLPRLTASLLKRPFTSIHSRWPQANIAFPNANIENVTERSC